MRLSLCVCTMDRSGELQHCLDAITRGRVQPDEVVVSDDSRHPAATAELCALYPRVKCVRGPQKGLCANRNFAVKCCSGDHVSLLDDDARVGGDFVGVCASVIASGAEKTIYTGDLLEHGTRKITPSNPTFLGFFGGHTSKELRTVHLNCNLFPRSAFRVAAFDERITYGYEDMDLCAVLLASGYRIQYRPEMVNGHHPPALSDAGRTRQAEQARYYTSLKRYLVVEGRPLKALAYLLLAPSHQVAHLVKTRAWRDIPGVSVDLKSALGQLLRTRRSFADLARCAESVR